jgi:flagellar motility protein MotE (MotC chaperone)
MKKIEDNLLEDLAYSIIDSRKEPKQETEDEAQLPEDLRQLEERKRARYEALLEKYRN